MGKNGFGVAEGGDRNSFIDWRCLGALLLVLLFFLVLGSFMRGESMVSRTGFLY